MVATCPLCGRPRAGEAWVADPDAPEEVEAQVETLGFRLDQLVRQAETPRRLYYRLPEMCPPCQGLLGGEEGPPAREALMLRIEARRRELLKRVRRRPRPTR